MTVNLKAVDGWWVIENLILFLLTIYIYIMEVPKEARGAEYVECI